MNKYINSTNESIEDYINSKRVYAIELKDIKSYNFFIKESDLLGGTYIYKTVNDIDYIIMTMT